MSRLLAPRSITKLIRSAHSAANAKDQYLRRPAPDPSKAFDLNENEKQVIFKLQKETKQDGYIPDVSDIINADVSLQSPDYFQVHNIFTTKELFNNRVHMGHKIGSLHPNMRPFVFGTRFDSVIFDLDLTAFHLRQALNFVAHISYRRGIILFITRSPSVLNIVEKCAIECGEYAHTRAWEETIFTDTIKKFSGITRLPDCIIFLNILDTVLAQHNAVKDAAKLLIPTVGIVDSNCDPNLISFPIPGNDDSYVSIEFYLKLFKEAILRGKSKRKLLEGK